MIASRSTGAAKANSLRRELELPRAANAVLKAILQLEVRLTLAGLRFPAGGSRVIVAAKGDMPPPAPAASQPSTS